MAANKDPLGCYSILGVDPAPTDHIKKASGLKLKSLDWKGMELSDGLFRRRAFALLLLLSAYLSMPACARKRPKIVIDQREDLDYVKDLCERKARFGKPCPIDPEADVGTFEAAIVEAVAIEPECHGVVWTRTKSYSQAGRFEPGWWLSLYFEDGAAAQDWVVIPRPGSDERPGIKGSGDAQGIARAVCMFATGRGGTIEK